MAKASLHWRFCRPLLRVFLLAMILPAASMAKELWLDGFVPTGYLYYYSRLGVIGDLRLNGKPISIGSRIVIFGPLTARSITPIDTFSFRSPTCIQYELGA